MKLFGSNRIANVMERLGIPEDTQIEHPMISRAIENAQKKVEQYYFGIRKQILEYDDVMNKQRDTIYTLRHKILFGENLTEKVLEMMGTAVDEKISVFFPSEEIEHWDFDGFIKALNEIVPIAGLEEIKKLKQKSEIRNSIFETLKRAYSIREQELGTDSMRMLEKIVMLRVIDSKWIEQLDNMDNLRDGIGLRGYGGKDPLVEYKIEGYSMFQEMMAAVREEVVSLILRVQISREGEEILQKKKNISYNEPKTPTAYGLPSTPQVHTKQAPIKKEVRVGRNDPCPCGSGKKYKKCCREGKV